MSNDNNQRRDNNDDRSYYASLPKWHEPHWNYDRYGNPIKAGTPTLEEFRASRAPKPKRKRERRLNDCSPTEWDAARKAVMAKDRGDK